VGRGSFAHILLVVSDDYHARKKGHGGLYGTTKVVQLRTRLPWPKNQRRSIRLSWVKPLHRTDWTWVAMQKNLAGFSPLFKVMFPIGSNLFTHGPFWANISTVPPLVDNFLSPSNESFDRARCRYLGQEKALNLVQAWKREWACTVRRPKISSSGTRPIGRNRAPQSLEGPDALPVQ
jgi:hypothetical protein